MIDLCVSCGHDRQVIAPTICPNPDNHFFTTQEAATEVLAFLHEIPLELGSFHRALIEAMFYADPTNRRKLAREFPALGNAVIAYKETGSGFRRLFEVAGYEVPAYADIEVEIEP